LRRATAPCHLGGVCGAVRLPKFFICGVIVSGQSSSSSNVVRAHGGNPVGLYGWPFVLACYRSKVRCIMYRQVPFHLPCRTNHGTSQQKAAI